MSERDARRALPSVQRVIESLPAGARSTLRATAARDAVAAARAEIDAGHTIAEDDVVTDAEQRLRVITLRLLDSVVNATGVILHTNLGRAPLGNSIVEAITRASGATNIEYRLDEGRRGSRHEHAGQLLADACGAEAGMVVNNNAAAVLLALATLARDHEVVVSRGELVEIGGGFRVPEIMAETGARLVEVGTTNRTRRADYEQAISDRTALLLKVHASNYRMVGFVEATPVAELTALGPPVMVDAGSGLLDEATPWLDHRPHWLRDEPGVRQCIEAGADIVTFSGDKLLGGPQAGVLVGTRALIERCGRHPLARAVRADKLTLAGLQELALAYLEHDVEAIEVWRLATLPMASLRARAETIAGAVPGAKVIDTDATAGGGSLPGLTIPSVGVAVAVGDVEGALSCMRAKRIVARTRDDMVVCDLRTVHEDHDALLRNALAQLMT